MTNSTTTEAFQPLVLLNHLLFDSEIWNLSFWALAVYGLVVILFSVLFVYGFYALAYLNSMLQWKPPLRYISLLMLLLRPPAVGVAYGIACLAIPTLLLYLFLGGTTKKTTYIGIFNSVSANFLLSPEPDETAKGGRYGLCLCMMAVVILTKCMQTLVPKPRKRSGIHDPNKNPSMLKDRAFFRSRTVIIVIYALFVSFFSFSAEYSSSRQTLYFLMILTIGSIVQGSIEFEDDVLLMVPFSIAIKVMNLYVARLSSNSFSELLKNHIIILFIHLAEILYKAEIMFYLSNYGGNHILKNEWILRIASTNAVTRRMYLKILKTLGTTVGVAEIYNEQLEKKSKFEELCRAVDEYLLYSNLDPNVGEVFDSETVEPTLRVMNDVSVMFAAYFIACLLIIFLWSFSNQLQLQQYGSLRPEYYDKYAFFSVFLLLGFSVAEPFVVSSAELRFGYKTYDYLVYCHYRFLQRETRFKWDENSLDECISFEYQKLDRLSFSSQFYWITTVCAMSLLMLIFGCQMIVVNSYSPFVDYAFVPMLVMTLTIMTTSQFLVSSAGNLFSIYKFKNENTEWRVHIEDDIYEKVKDDDFREEVEDVIRDMCGVIEKTEVFTNNESSIFSLYRFYRSGIECSTRTQIECNTISSEDVDEEEVWESLLAPEEEPDILVAILKIMIASSIAALVAPIVLTLMLSFLVHMMVTTADGRNLAYDLLLAVGSVCLGLCLSLCIFILFAYIFVGNPPASFYWIFGAAVVFALICYQFFEWRKRRMLFLLAKIERRRSRRSEEDLFQDDEEEQHSQTIDSSGIRQDDKKVFPMV